MMQGLRPPKTDFGQRVLNDYSIIHKGLLRNYDVVKPIASRRTGSASCGVPAAPGRSRCWAAARIQCAPPCQTPATATLEFDRQHELTQTIAAAFFDAYLAGDRSARCWLARRLARQNPDVATRRH